MKKLKTFASSMMLSVLVLFSVTTYADRPVLDVLVPSSTTGNAWAEGNLIRDALENIGYDSEIIHTKNCVNTVDYMSKNTGRPAIFIRSSSRYVSDESKNCHKEITEDTYVTTLYVRLQTMCVRADKEFVTINDFLNGKQRITVATTSSLPAGIYDDLSESTGVRFVRVDYDGSKSIIQGVISGDTDLMYSGYTKREIGNDQLKCFTTSADQEVNGLAPMKVLFPKWKLNTLGTVKYFHAVNIPADRLSEVRSTLNNIIDNDPKITTYISKANMQPGTEITDGIKTFLNSVNLITGAVK